MNHILDGYLCTYKDIHMLSRFRNPPPSPLLSPAAHGTDAGYFCAADGGPTGGSAEEA